MDKHIFWWGLSMACIGWYLLICVYVGIKGGGDIRRMIKRMGEQMVNTENRQAGDT